MVSRQSKKQMQEFLVEALRDGGYNAEPKSREVVSGITTNLIAVENGGVVLIDKYYPGKSMNNLYDIFKRENIAYVFLKDGETFFKNAWEKNFFKKSQRLSLKHYDKDDLHKMILFRPEEKLIRNSREQVQYYQPASSRLQEGLRTFQFKNVRLDYSHISSNERFKPDNKNSEKLFIWTNEEFSNGNLCLDKGYLE